MINGITMPLAALDNRGRKSTDWPAGRGSQSPWRR